MLMAIFTLTMTASTTNLSLAIAHVLNEGLVLRPSFVFALAALVLVAVAETGRIPGRQSGDASGADHDS